MNIYSYALKSFRHNAGKGIIFAIALSVMLLIAVLNIATSLQRTIYEEAISTGGDAHAQYSYITSQQAEQIASHESVKWTDTWMVLNQFGVVFEKNSNITILHSSGLGVMEGFKLASGNAPQEENEVAIQPHLARALGIEPKIGESFTLTAYTIDSETSYDFVISGIMQEQPYHDESDNFILFVSEEFVLKHGSFSEQHGRDYVGFGKNDMRMMFVHFNRGVFPADATEELARLIEAKDETYSINYTYIFVTLNDLPIILGVGAILLILMAIGALVINNVFNMMNARRTRSFGLLTLIGASKRQLRRVVYIEALLNTAIAIPIGLILGTAFGYFGIMPIQEALNARIIPVYYASPWSYVLTIALAAVMALVGVARPALKASRIVPVEAVRFAGATEKTYNRKKQESNITIPVLSRLNMQRHRGRTVSVVLSLMFSGMLILGFSTVGLSMLAGTDDYARQFVAGDVRLSAGEEYSYVRNSDAITPEIIDTLRSNDDVESIKTFMSHGYCLSFFRSGDMLLPNDSGELTGVDEETMRELLSYVIDGNPTMEQMQDGISVIAVNSDISFMREYNYELGQEVEVYLCDEGRFATEDKVTFRVAGILNLEEMPRYIDNWGFLPELIMPQSSFEQHGLFTTISYLSIDSASENHDELIAFVRNMCNENGNISFEAYQIVRQEFYQQVIGLLSLLMLILAVVTLVGILNLMSSTFIGIEQRRREFGVMAALGLSPKGLRELLTREGIVISLSSTFSAVVLGLGAGYGMYRFMSYYGGASYMDFTFPTIPLIALLLIYGFVPYFVMSAAVKRLAKQTTVELLGQEA